MAGVCMVVWHPLDMRARARAHTYVRTRARHGKHQINHLINFAEVVVVVVVVVMVAAVMVAVNSKRLVRYFALTFTSVVNDAL